MLANKISVYLSTFELFALLQTLAFIQLFENLCELYNKWLEIRSL